ncbi:Ganglioside GM2 activator precursor, putative [Entamoeba invadens IP1]|uniref:Ganglioside GM2 activator, putative n=1 Tax=Entamoeba invadens IP1 TaxID=370355 RepID=A0A0A1UDV5_ENTIV|nr:Ganglioside GM2 activator precursor, putative [Entamoeba invadens IP1]ELP91976.1 Ganglioside GM2 activator precursor, putative [Entamoeba invadens IP1]|eukprot:XP_004258747.1 Ganglioside GM2 activator precursor, putative [Entamoeba invadens IP1]
MFALLLLATICSAKTYPLTITSCNTTAPVIIHTLTVQPDNPINLKTGFTMNMDIEITKPIEKAKLSLVFEKDVLFWVTIPCANNVGSCTYENVCDILANVTDKCMNATRSRGYDNVPCSCPIAANRFVATIPVPTIEVPSKYAWLASGNYKIHLEMSDDGNNLACYDVKFSLTV